MKKIIPNAITSANLLCGCIAITQISQGNFVFASLLVLLGAFFDFFDGMAARLLKAGSAIGAQLDSLADVVTFGVAPAYLVFASLNQTDPSLFNYQAFLIAIFSAVRLAKFNVDERQTSSFIGLPTPANALFWISIPLIQWQIDTDSGLINPEFLSGLFQRSLLIYCLILLFSYLLIAELPLFSLKFKNTIWSENKYRYILLVSSVILIGLFLFAAIPIILLLYVILSIIKNPDKKANEI